MEVILREHVENLGRRGDVVKVADGYARNYLLPRKLALPATPANMKVVERQRKIADAARGRPSARAPRRWRRGWRRSSRHGPPGRRARARCTGRSPSADIAEDLAGKGFEIDKRKIQLAEPIKQLGEFTVPIKLHRDVVAQRARSR